MKVSSVAPPHSSEARRADHCEATVPVGKRQAPVDSGSHFVTLETSGCVKRERTGKSADITEDGVCTCVNNDS